MNRTEHLLCCLAEECSEVAQRVSKAMRFGLYEEEPGQALNNSKRISVELSDLMAVVEMLQDVGAIGSIEQRLILDKKEKVKDYLEYSKHCGTLKGL